MHGLLEKKPSNPFTLEIYFDKEIKHGMDIILYLPESS